MQDHSELQAELVKLEVKLLDSAKKIVDKKVEISVQVFYSLLFAIVYLYLL